MSREIKFRVWDGLSMDDSPFWHDHSLDSEGQLIEVNEAGPSDESWREAERCSCVLMQYTGLKDKNGVEIYEGDIVREYDTDSDKSWVSEVVWSFSYKPGFDVPNQIAEQIEVIGNTYENPELLK